MVNPNKIYTGIIQGYSKQSQGYYNVFIPEFSFINPEYETISAKNKTNKYAKWYNNSDKTVYSSGSYFPLTPGMQVDVKFKTTSLESGEIIAISYDETPLTKDDEESFYLLGKSVGGTYVFTDDKRDVTQIIHKKGVSNILMTSDKISMSINETSNLGTNFLSGVELSKEGIYLKFGNTIFIMDDSGFRFKVGKANYVMDDKGFKTDTENVTVKAKNYEIQADKIFINGLEETHIKSTVTRVTGGQHLSLNGNVVNIDSNLNTTVGSNNAVNIKSLVHTSIDSPMINIDALGTLLLKGSSTLLTGLTTVVNGITTVINGANIFEDSMIIRGMGVGTSVATSLEASLLATKYSLLASDISLTTAFHFNDPYSGMACNAMTETLTGVAQGAPNPMPEVIMNPSFDYINSYLQYINKGSKVGNIGTVDLINSLSGNSFKSIYNIEGKLDGSI